MTNTPHPILLTILDGWGYSSNSQHNAIAQADTPHWDRWWHTCPHALINCAGPAVGLPPGQMGNSEVGHMHMGAGRVVAQDYTRINNAIDSGEFAGNSVLTAGIKQAIKQQRPVQVIGLLSPGGVHSHEDHIHALVDLVHQLGGKLCIHAILDGRDTPPRSAEASLRRLQAKLTTLACGEIGSIVGRYYAMDRDKRWGRTQLAYELYTAGVAHYHAQDPVLGLAMAYARDERDEFVQPTITSSEVSVIADDDVLICMNFRADRMRQLAHAFTDRAFTDFQRGHRPDLAAFITLTEYAADLRAQIIFLPEQLHNTLGEYIAKLKLQQLRIAETEKYAHVTFFFNGGMEDCFTGEERILIPSPKVATYDLQPEMSAPALTAELRSAILSKKYDVIICNFANADMVGHSGNIVATIAAVECLDHCLGEIHQAITQAGGEMLITADHGNAECMYNAVTEQAHTAHTNEPVPFVYLGRPAAISQHNGGLIDIAPTILYLMDLQIPTEMTGRSLLKLTGT